MSVKPIVYVLTSWLLLCSGQLVADEQKFQRFLDSVYSAPPSAKSLWLSADDKAEIYQRFNYRLNRLRQRYWFADEASVWVLEEVGKEKPITMAVAVKDQKVSAIEVLAYRESRGGEIRHNFFRKQFIDASLTEKNELSQNIDGITGATLSVRAMQKVAKVALFLDQKAGATAQ
ncbi:FMN-binding protein [Agaribacterium haliotis]|uniref:FMN-binding protein n=1 Tax=Agaribacterium haliotis TaxID=2013869 RepID=UPI000BB57F57|nr:FMN-binding protein [Agaribacterium haliotis]